MSLVLAGFLITALLFAARPEIFEKKAADIINPIKEWTNQKDAERLAAAKEESFKNWMFKYNLPNGCANAQSALKELECRKDREEYISQFEWNWRNRLNSGWKPN